MLVLRFFGALTLLALGASLVMYVLTRDRMYLRALRYTVLFAGALVIILFVVLMAERIALLIV